MTAPRRVALCDPDCARREYEHLRANALGALNRAARFTLFLRDGMSTWLQALPGPAGTPGTTWPTPPAGSGALDADGPGAQLAAILTDVILATGPVGGPGGTR